MDIALVIRRRLEALELEQRELASASQVTESYISQLLTRKKAPPDPARSDIYAKMETCLQLPPGELVKLANVQRQEALQRKLADPPTPLFHEVRQMILRKCQPETAPYLRAIFEKEPFGAIERLITQKLLDVVKSIAKEELAHESWLRQIAQLGGRSYEQMRVLILEFLDTDVFSISLDNCVSFLEPVLASWDIDLATFEMEIALNHHLAPGPPKRFAFVERDADPPKREPGLQAFLQDTMLSGDATTKEIAFLSTLRFTGKRPTALYYYRALQNLRDPLHFRPQ